MAQNIWREKVGSTLITIMLTALGAVAFQSAKYAAWDYPDATRASNEWYDTKIEEQKVASERWKDFEDSRREIDKRSRDRRKLLMELMTSLPKRHLDRRRLSDALSSAYSDLGSMSYAPAFGSALEAERAATVEELKVELEGLNLLHNWVENPGNSKAKTKLLLALEQNLYREEQTLNGSLAVSKALHFFLDDQTRELDRDLKRYKKELREQLRSATVAIISLTLSLIGYILLLSYMTPAKSAPAVKEGESKQTSE